MSARFMPPTEKRYVIWLARRFRIEIAGCVQARVNSLTTPFILRWRRASGWPWDWKLIAVNNPALEIPPGLE